MFERLDAISKPVLLKTHRKLALLLDKELLKRTGIFALVSSEVVATVVGGFLVGNWLDEKWGISPLLRFALPFTGFGYSVWRINNFLRAQAKRDKLGK